ncbi:hypothetical protein ACVDG8_010370 [Mesorhizobium sp. ORM8.1]
MHGHHVSVADGEAFLSASRMLFGPITQRFSRGEARVAGMRLLSDMRGAQLLTRKPT